MDAAEMIELANQRMTIVQACNHAGLELGDFAVASLKVYCPFGHLYHPNGGISKDMRVYPGTNSAYCFAGCGYFTPVKMISMTKDVPEEQAAEFILEVTNYVAPDYEAQWDALMSEEPQVGTADLAEALKVACARHSPKWESLQFDPGVAAALTKCLSLLPKVRTQEDADRWLGTTKTYMKSVIG